MSNLLDDSLVGLALLVSAGYVISSLGPRSLRHRLLAALSRLLAKAPAFLGLGRLAHKLAAASVIKAKGACGGCDNCGAEQTTPAESATTQSAATEIKVSVEKIGRRA
jgi:hypothetical protein